MHIDRIYIQENFMPDPVGDPFKRVTFGIGIAINPGENVDHAIEEAEKQIKLYINKNTHYPEHLHVEERNLPEIQKEEGSESLEDLINNAPDIPSLQSFQFLAKGNAALSDIYAARMRELTTDK